jgi:hypothetical protein
MLNVSINYRIIHLILAILVVSPSIAETDVLFVNSDGELRHGRPEASTAFRGIGVNYYDAFQRHLLDGNDKTFTQGFEALGNRNIPFARFNAGGFWPSDWNLYQSNESTYWRRMDHVIEAAETHGVGLIPTFFWNWHAVPDLVGDSAGTGWADRSTSTHHFAKKYVEKFIDRYQSSSAIWAYEIGNEWNNQKDLPETNGYYLPRIVPSKGTPTTRTDADALTSEIHRYAFSELASVIRANDSERAILSGNTIPRSSAWNLRVDKSWEPDTRDEFRLELANDNPGETDTLSAHVYFDNTRDHRFDDGQAGYGEVIAEMKAVADSLGKPLLLGEFGTKEGETNMRKRFDYMLSVYESQGIDLAALWVFDYAAQPEWSVRWDNDRSWMLDAIEDWNLENGSFTASENQSHEDAIPEPSGFAILGLSSLVCTLLLRPVRELENR